MPKRRYHGKRAVLNRPGYHSTGTIVAELEDTSKWKPGKDGEGNELGEWGLAPEYILQISDCSRAVVMSMDWHDEEDVKNNLYKLDTMIAALTSMREGMDAEIALWRERKKYIKERDRKSGRRASSLDDLV